MLHLDLFSGIGGFAYASEQVWPNVEHIFCDNDEFCQEVLKKHWPESKIYGDIRTLTNSESKQTDITKQRGLHAELGISDRERPYILTGGFPCQPFSQAGRRRGTEDNRYLWPEMLRVIKEFKPRWIVGENVAGILSMVEQQSNADLEGEDDSEDDNNGNENAGGIIWDILNDIEQAGYSVQTFVIPAVAVNAPHRRDRVWIVANSTQFRDSDKRLSTGNRKHQEPSGESRRGDNREQASWDNNWFEVATRLCRVDDGIRYWVDGLGRKRNSRNPRLKALGNAIVPQVAAEIMRAIKSVDDMV